MKEKDLENLFEKFDGQFDFEEPEMGHQERFLEKLNQSKGVVTFQKKRTVWWKPLSIAASIVLLAAVGIQLFNQEPSIQEQVVEIAPEVSQTEFHFASLVEEKVQELKSLKSSDNEQLVDDTLKQLVKLESDYKKLEQDLINGGNDKIILNAMIINFQTRIDLLQEVLNNIEEIKNLKANNDANFTI